MTADEVPEGVVGWDVPGWDWPEGDYSWLASQSGLHVDGTSIFFIHGGRIRHQTHVPEGSYTLAEFTSLLAERMDGLDGPRVCWHLDTGNGEASLWVEGTRAPGPDDLNRLQAVRDQQTRDDRSALKGIQRRHPDWFGEDGPNP